MIFQRESRKRLSFFLSRFYVLQGKVTKIGTKITLETDKSSAPFGYYMVCDFISHPIILPHRLLQGNLKKFIRVKIGIKVFTTTICLILTAKDF